MNSANPAPTARPLRTSGVNLVRLALALAGATRIEEVLGRAIGLLSGDQPEMAWAILHRLQPGKYGATSTPGVSYEDLRLLCDATCGRDNWLSLGSLLSPRSTLGRPISCSIRGGDSGAAADPDLVLAQWSHLGHELDEADPDLQTAARLIACSAGAASVFEYLLEQTSHDPLTGLLNRAGILEVLGREVARSQRTASDLSVLFLDLDRFKEVNDIYGHAVGDGVLRNTARLLSGGIRASDALGRIGGDEFLVVLPDTDLRVARRIGRRLQKVLQSAGGRPSGLSYGGASLDEAGKIGEMLELADQRMLSQKRRRRVQSLGRVRHGRLSPNA